jgi:hypothetical protein
MYINYTEEFDHGISYMDKLYFDQTNLLCCSFFSSPHPI